MLLMLDTIQLLLLLAYLSMLFSNFCLMLSKNPTISLSVWIGAALLEKYTTASFSTTPSGSLIFRMVVLVTVCALTFSPCWRQCCKRCRSAADVERSSWSSVMQLIFGLIVKLR